MAASTTPRFAITSKNDDNTGRVQTNGFLAPAYAASIALKPNAATTTVVPAQLTGALTLTVDVTRSYAADELRILFSGDASARTVTFSTGFVVSAATLALSAGKKGSIAFVFDGAAFVEVGRCIGV